MAFSEISNILQKNLQNKGGLSKQITASLICEEFDKIVVAKWGSVAKDKIKAMYFKDNILTIATLSSVFAQEVKLHEKEILDLLNKKFGLSDVTKIRYLV